MLQAAADHLVTTLSEASRILQRDLVDVMILGVLATSPGNLSVLGLADSLNLPRETCRRRVDQLRKDGWIQPRTLALVRRADSPHAERLCACSEMVTRQSDRFAITAAGMRLAQLEEVAAAASTVPLDVAPTEG